MKQPLSLVLDTGDCPHDAATRSHRQRGLRGAGRHIQSRGAQRRAERMLLQALLRQPDPED